MILIISEPNDYSTDEVLRWLKYYNIEYTRINYTDPVCINNFKIDEEGVKFDIVFHNKTVQYSKISGVYYRRGMLNIHKATIKNISDNKSLNRLIIDEVERLQEFIHSIIEKGNTIGSFKNRSLNKLVVLEIAQSLGLDIPRTFIETKKEEVINLINENEIVTKNISEVAHVLVGSEQFNSLTYAVNQVLIDNSSESFLYSLFQSNIKKDFEIRSFFIRGKFFSTAMLTQMNDRTTIDFRNYDDEKPTRIVPYQLPNEIEDKLQKVFEKLDLNTGSVDMIYGQGKYFFLEINPVGQFGMIGEPCNYYLENEIVNDLIKNSKN